MSPAPSAAPRFDADSTFSAEAVLVLSFGGPEQPSEVMPFLRRVTAGRNVPDERLAEVATQYERFGGRSPINDQNRALIQALETELHAAGFELPVYFGNRNSEPFLPDTVARMETDGVRRAVVFVTSAFGSYSGCRQYREDLQAAANGVSIELRKLRLFYNHPGFIEPVAARTATALAEHEQPPVILFTAHSIPDSMAATCDYEAQLREAAGLVVDRLEPGSFAHWELVFQSRSGPPQVPWLEPYVNDRLQELVARSCEAQRPVTLVPLGFISDHMEVLFDLDTQAVETADALGLRLNRAATVGTDQRFVTMIRQLIEEQVLGADRLWLGASGPWPDSCPDGHCALPVRPGRPPAARP